MSSMLSAPAAMPAIRQGIFSRAFTPHRPPTLRCSLASSARPQRCARAITGTRPARDTRFGSSNDACVLAGSCNNRTCEVSSPARRRKLQQLPSSQFRGHLSRRHAPIHTHLRGGLRLRRGHHVDHWAARPYRESHRVNGRIAIRLRPNEQSASQPNCMFQPVA